MCQPESQFERGYGMLSDIDIRAYIERGSIQIFNAEYDHQALFDLDAQLQINAIDLYVGPEFRRFKLSEEYESVTQEKLKDRAITELFDCQKGENLRIEPGELLLASTRETVVLDKTVSGYVVARNGVGRLGILVNCTAPLIKPGHHSTIPLQLVNLNSYPVDIKLDVAVCQITFFSLSTPSSVGYSDIPDSKYVGEGSEPQESKLYDEQTQQLQRVFDEPSAESSTNNARRDFSGRLQNALQHNVVRGGIGAYAVYSVVEYLGSLLGAKLSDVASFLSGVPFLGAATTFLGGIPLNFVLGLFAVIVLFKTTERDGQ